METKGICRIGQTLVCWSTYELFYMHTLVGIFIILTQVSADVITFGHNERTELGYFISA